MKQWEYYMETNATPLNENVLNKFGNIGWELFQVIEDSDGYYTYFFKREILKVDF